MKHTIWCLAGLLISAITQAASFDCGKAQTDVEKLVCANSSVSELDSKVYQEYSRALKRATPEKASQIIIEQKDWLKNVRNICASAVCLSAAYTSRMQAISGSTASSNPLTRIAEFASFRVDDYGIFFDRGTLYFSQYDKSGNNFDVMSLEMANQKSEVVMAGRYGGKFIAQNDKYLVVSEKARLTNPLVLIDRKTGQQVKQIKLQQVISWAKIEGNHLVAMQGASNNGGYLSTAHALIFELPSLKIIKSIDIAGGNDVQFWQGKILSLGRDLVAYDLALNEQFTIPLPARQASRNGVSCAATWPLRIYDDKAVIVANCGEILVYDLISHRLENTIASYAHFYAVAVLDGLIFTTPTSEPRQKNNAHVFDLYTGKELAVLPINGTDIFAQGNQLLVVERKFAAHSPMVLYLVNTSAIRNGKWRVEQVITQCKQAESLLTDSNDLYAAIGLCKSAGIEGLIDGAEIPPDALPVLKKYSLWLSRTFDKGTDAIRLLKALQTIKPDREINSALDEISFKTKVIEGKEFDDISAQDKLTDFYQVFERGSQVAKAATKNIDFGAFPDLFHFSGDRIYVGRYGCRRCTNGGASILVLNRNTLEEIASIPIVPDDQDYQDNITSITTDEKHIYVSVEYRYEQAGRPNFFVIDRGNLKVVTKAQIKNVSTLNFDAGQLMSCGCNFTEDQHCKALDPVALRFTNALGKFCIQVERGNETIVGFDEVTGSTPNFVVATQDYLVSSTTGARESQYLFFPKAGGQPIVSPQGLGDSLKWPVSVDGNFVLISEAIRGGQLVKLFSVPSGSVQTLFGLPTTHSRFPVPIINRGLLYVGYGRDLMVFDLESNRPRRFIKDFVLGGFKDNSHGLDMNRISRLFIDQGKLIALTFYGENTRIIQLSDL